MAENDDDEPAPEHVRFMTELVENMHKMVGEDKMVSCIGDEKNGVYAILLSLNPLPPSIILMAIVNMLTNRLMKEMAERHNTLVEAGTAQGSKMVN